jgi:hypothetical protein
MALEKRTRSTLLRRAHLASAVIWAGLLVPSVIWWSKSLLWIIFMSVYSIIVAHLSAYQGARAEKEAGSGS